MDPNKALAKIMNTCARAEKCSWDVRQKLRRWDLSESQIESIIKQLTEQEFVDDERFARAYVKDKSQFNSWGKTKIRYHLQAKRIPAAFISKAMKGIKEEVYHEQLEYLLRNKIRTIIPIEDYYQAKAKLVRFAASRGFEAELVYSTVDKLLKEISS